MAAWIAILIFLIYRDRSNWALCSTIREWLRIVSVLTYRILFDKLHDVLSTIRIKKGLQ